MTSGTDQPKGVSVARIELPVDSRAASLARDQLVRVLQRLDVDDKLTHLVLLLVSELVTNAVLHARSDPVVEVRATTDTLWIGVDDPDSRLPQLQEVDAGAMGGRGLHLIDSFADDWGAQPIPGDGKTVWFTVPR